MNRKMFCKLALSASVAVSFAGCAASRPGAILSTSGPQGRTVTADRLMTVAETFESQQNYGKAKELYQLVLERQPGNFAASQRVAWIDSLGTANPLPMPVSPQPMTPQPAASVQMAQATPSGTTFDEVVESAKRTQPRIDAVDTAALAASEVDAGNPIAKPTAEQPSAVHQGEWAAPETEASASIELVGSSENEDSVEPAVGRFEMPVGYSESQAEAATFEAVASADAGIEQYVDHPELAVPQLAAFLNNPDPEIRSLAAFLIGEAGFKGTAALGAMNDQLVRETHEAVKIAFAEGIAKVDSNSESAFTALAIGLRSNDALIRSQSAFAMRVFAPTQRAECVNVLLDGLRDEEPAVRSMAALSLGDFSGAATPALTALQEALNDNSADVREAAQTALARLAQ